MDDSTNDVKTVPGNMPSTAYGRSRTGSKSYASTKQPENSLLGSWSTATWIWIILVPIIVWVILIVLIPSFVTDGDGSNGQNQVDHRQVLLWTLVISVVIWVLLWSLNYCKSC